MSYLSDGAITVDNLILIGLNKFHDAPFFFTFIKTSKTFTHAKQKGIER
jgi:hypothetical protein